MHSLTLIVPSSSVQNSTGPATAGRSFVPIALALALAWFTVPPTAWAADGDLGYHNTAEGFNALAHLTTGVAVDNTAIGFLALGDDTTGSDNTASGAGALNVNTTGNNNTATGYAALYSNIGGNNNTANGTDALVNNTNGSSNTGEGANALFANNSGSNNTALGFNAGNKLTTGSNNIDIGANVPGVAGEANTIRVGKQGTQHATFIAGIFGTTVSGSTVVVNSSGRLGVASSSARFKKAIKPMDKASEAILALKPVRFRYKEEI